MPQGSAWLEVKKRIAPQHRRLIKGHRDLFWYYVSERWNIYERRESGREFPWTKDPILRDYHFTNVSRFFDKGTGRLLFLLADSTDDLMNLQDAIWWVVQYRWPNYHTLYEDYGWIPHNFNRKRWLRRIERTKEKHGKWHTSAHIVLQSNFKQTRAENFLYYLGLLDDSFDDFCDGILDAPNMETAFRHVIKYKGFGGFTAYEILVDLCYIGLLPDEFRDQFANAGPGCREGIDLIYPNRTHMGYTVAMEHLRDTQGRAFKRLGLQSPPRLLLQDIEFCLCEFSKYVKILHGTGKRRKYVYVSKEKS